jgi:hypothetical protein
LRRAMRAARFPQGFHFERTLVLLRLQGWSCVSV